MAASRPRVLALLKRRLAAALPVVVVLAIAFVLMYPIALWLGLPLAKLRMDNVANWVTVTTAPHALAEVPADSTAGAAAGARLAFGGAPSSLSSERALLTYAGQPLAARFGLEDGVAVLHSAIAGPLFAWGAELTGPLAAGHVYVLPEGTDPAAAIYLAGRLLLPGATEAVERPDGVQTTFTFPDEADGPVIVGQAVLLEGDGFVADGHQVTLSAPAPFNSVVRRVSGDYAVVDPASGSVVLAVASSAAPRAAAASLALAELLVGEVDGANRKFQLQHAPLVESDAQRRIMLNGTELSAEAERPQERVDGERATFTFAGERGVVTINGTEVEEGRGFSRSGNTITFATPPARNAAIRQYADYLVSDPTTGTITLAVAPQPGSSLWAPTYTYYDHPACGTTELECFLSMPQHPMPFPNWIVKRLAPFFGAYALSDSRNVVRATLYTAGGTLTALLLGGVFGVLLAILFVAVRPLEQALLPWVIASQTVPIIALVPVLLLLLGNVGVTVQTSLVPAALIGAYIAFFPVTVGTVTGLRSVDPLSLDLMKSYAASPVQLFWKVRFPAAVPYLFVSLKLGAAAALVGALVAETESNNRLGLGYAIVGQVQAGNVSDVWILLFISAILGIGLVSIVGLLQRFIAPWERR